jgi:hypothetical protein
MASKKLKMKRKGPSYYLEHTRLEDDGSPSANQDPSQPHAHCRIVISRDPPTGAGWSKLYSNPSAGKHLEVVHTRTLSRSVTANDPMGTCDFDSTSPAPSGAGGSDEVNYCICGDRTGFPCGATQIPDCDQDPIVCLDPTAIQSVTRRPVARKKKRPAGKRKK